jgi:hypothetical protein
MDAGMREEDGGVLEDAGMLEEDGGMLEDAGLPDEFCMASTPPSELREGRCRNDDGTVDQNATGTCLVDRDYMEFF